jgi:hypothetical protein
MILCLTKKYFYSYTGYLQEHILDKNMIDVQNEGWKEYFNNKYNIGAGDYENLRSQWVEV